MAPPRLRSEPERLARRVLMALALATSSLQEVHQSGLSEPRLATHTGSGGACHNRSVSALLAALAPLRERPFRLLFLGRTFSGAGDALVPVATTFAVLEIGTATDLGLVLACHWGARVVFLLAGGVWSDRLPRQLVMIAADVVRAIAQAAVAAAFFFDAARVWHLAVAAAALGLAAAFFNPASTGLVQSLVTRERLQEANALLGLTRGASHVAGPAVAGVLVTTVGFGTVFAIDAATFVVSLVCLAAMRLPPELPARQRTSALREALEGLRVMRERRWIVAGLGCDVVVNVALGVLFVLGPVAVAEHHGGARDWGLIMTAASVGGLLGSAVALRVKPIHPLRVAYVLSLATPAMLLALAPPVPVVALMVAAAAMFFAIVTLNTYWTTMQQQHVPPNAISRVDSLAWLGSLVVMPAAMALAGACAAVVGVRAMLVGAAAVSVAAIAGALAVRDLRDLQYAAAAEDPTAPPVAAA